jgi:RIO kinase 2
MCCASQATLIDFPQMVSTSHANAAMFFERDVNCIRTWFGKRYNFFSDDFPLFANDVNKKVELDISLAASGFSKEEAAQLEQVRFDVDVDLYVFEFIGQWWWLPVFSRVQTARR